jgi:hypothetical protein
LVAVVTTDKEITERQILNRLKRAIADGRVVVKKRKRGRKKVE